MIGIDMVRVDRIRDIKHKERFLSKVLTSSEINQYHLLTNPNRQDQWLAGRFAAKEAIIKVIQPFISMSNIELENRNKKLVFQYNNFTIHVSISHEKDYAIAIALLKDGVT